jgi:S1-C subfamily serine protease
MPSYEEYGFPARPRRYRESARTWPALVILLVVFVLGGLLVGYFVFRGSNRNLHNPNVQPREVVPKSEPGAIEKQRIQVFKDISPSVVNVDTLRIQRKGYVGLSERAVGTGSGFVWDTQGRIVTNFHVVRDTLEVGDDGSVGIRSTATVRVTLAGGSSWNARLVGVAPDNDLAVLQIDAPADQLKPIPVGSSGDLEVGQTVYAIGNPYGERLTFTHGIVSALDREIQSATDRPITGVIQTDASLNPGNSGGPLLDKDGRLIGVNTAITSPSGGNVGIGYAIPVDTVNRVVTELIRTGRAPTPALGIVLLRDRDTRSLGFDKGVIIAEVLPGGAADKAGLHGFHTDQATGRQTPGDLILAVNGEPVNTIADLQKAMSKLQIRQTITLTIRRGDETRDVKVTMEGI